MDKILNRKIELIRRDPLYDQLCQAFHEVIDSKMSGLIDQALPKDFDALHRAEMHEHNPQEWSLLMNVIKLRDQIISKWNVFLRFNFPPEKITIEPLVEDSAIWVGPPQPSSQGFGWNTVRPPLKEWSPYPKPSGTTGILLKRIPALAGLWLPIMVNISRLNKADAKAVKKHLWSVIEANLLKNSTRSPSWDDKACGFLYKLRQEETFQNYLRWYDIHAKEKMSFRLIAAMDRSRDASQFLERVRQKKFKWGLPVKGEDNVEKGVNRIYKAIYRTEYGLSAIRPVIEEYDCPDHGIACPSGCKYSKKWSDMFDRLMPKEPPKDLVLMEKSEEDEDKDLDHPLDIINYRRFKGKRTPAIRPER